MSVTGWGPAMGPLVPGRAHLRISCDPEVAADQTAELDGLLGEQRSENHRVGLAVRAFDEEP